MNRKQLIVLIVLLAVLGGAGVLLMKQQDESWSGGGGAIGSTLLKDFDVNAVGALVITQGTNTVHLEKKDGLWKVRERDDYPANYGSISEFIIKASELKPVQVEEAGPKGLARLELAEGEGEGEKGPCKVQFLDQDGKPLKTLLLGKQHMRKSTSPQAQQFGGGEFPDGRYVRLGDATDQIALVSETFSMIQPQADRWLNKDFFKVEKAKALSVSFAEATNSFKLTREQESDDWTLVDAAEGETLDSSKISSLKNPLSSPSFNDVLTDDQAKDLKLPVEVVIDTFDGFTYTLKTGEKKDNDYLLQVSISADLPKEREPAEDEKEEDKERLDKEFADQQTKLKEKLEKEKKLEGRTFLVSSWTLDSILKTRSEILAEPKEEEAESGDKSATTNSDVKVPDFMEGI